MNKIILVIAILTLILNGCNNKEQDKLHAPIESDIITKDEKKQQSIHTDMKVMMV